MKHITEFRFGDVSVNFSEDERVIVQDDDVKLDVETETFKQICIQYLCLECPDVIKFDGDNEEVVFFCEDRYSEWKSYNGSDTFDDGERVVAWSYVDDLELSNK